MQSCSMQDTQDKSVWEHSTGQLCQDLAWEKLHTGDWKSVLTVSLLLLRIQILVCFLQLSSFSLLSIQLVVISCHC